MRGLEGRPLNVSPARKGWGSTPKYDLSAVGAALCEFGHAPLCVIRSAADLSRCAVEGPAVRPSQTQLPIHFTPLPLVIPACPGLPRDSSEARRGTCGFFCPSDLTGILDKGHRLTLCHPERSRGTWRCPPQTQLPIHFTPLPLVHPACPGLPWDPSEARRETCGFSSRSHAISEVQFLETQ